VGGCGAEDVCCVLLDKWKKEKKEYTRDTRQVSIAMQTIV
jgi:hypothetical protein